jgi:4-hydroxybenzoate polyprenyltransferase
MWRPARFLNALRSNVMLNGSAKSDFMTWASSKGIFSAKRSSLGTLALGGALWRHRAAVWAASTAVKFPAVVAWIRLLRVHQYAKNALVLVPLLTAHRFDLQSCLHAFVALVAFSICASAGYIVNDLADIDADRRHLTKRSRPLASGAVRPIDGIFAVPMLLAAAACLAVSVSLPFLEILIGYFMLSTAYTFVLKKKVMIDVVALALLYTIRVWAGAVAIGVTISEWLLAFSLLVFFALGLVKRYTELAARHDAGLPEDILSRDYHYGDLNIVGALAAASALNAITIFILYISSDSVRKLYAHPEFLWAICPIFLYWLSRILVLAHRRLVHHDPVIFALTDTVSLASFLAMLIVIFLAI